MSVVVIHQPLQVARCAQSYAHPSSDDLTQKNSVSVVTGWAPTPYEWGGGLG